MPVETLRTRRPEMVTQDGAGIGTWAYMAPEQAQGKTREISTRSDVFGLGAILCEILTGYPPYRQTNRAALVRAAEDAARRAAVADRRPKDGDGPRHESFDRRDQEKIRYTEPLRRRAAARSPAARSSLVRSGSQPAAPGPHAYLPGFVTGRVGVLGRLRRLETTQKEGRPGRHFHRPENPGGKRLPPG